MKPQPATWLVKSEPASYSFAQLIADGSTSWTGVRNFQARNNLAAMRQGDEVLFYHSVTGKEIVGVARVTRTAFPDPTATEGSWQAVEIAPVRTLAKPVSLAAIKAEPKLRESALLRQSRISVIPIRPEEYAQILAMADAG